MTDIKKQQYLTLVKKLFPMDNFKTFFSQLDLFYFLQQNCGLNNYKI